MSALADDSMEGRMTGSRGSAKAATFIARQMASIGLVPEGDSGYFQRVPIALTPRSNGQERLTLMSDFASLDTFPPDHRRPGVNVVGMLRGTDPALAQQVVLVDAHYDHLGIGKPVNGDSIYNGADDDASGTTAVIEIARALAAGPPPKRSILFVATTGEEVGLLGTRWFIQHPPVSLKAIVSNLEIEMIGRPDSLAGGPGRAWLTGYERSTMGAMFTAAGLPIVADARPSQHFFERSDNIAYAQMGIPAHTLSTYNMHSDYHRPSDELSRIDFGHMTRVIQAGAQAVRILADGPVPTWNKGGQPAPR
jgi:Zn-dependent M28 family amino/carboxypeptidase